MSLFNLGELSRFFLLIYYPNLPDVLRHIRPRSVIWRGFSFLIGGAPMIDRVQAKKDLQFCCDELSKYQNLSRSGLSRGEMMTIDGIMIRLKEQIKNLRTVLHA